MYTRIKKRLITATNLTLVLLLIATTSLALEFVQAGRLQHTNARSWLLVSALIATILGWLLGKTRIEGWITLPAVFLTGLIWSFITVGNLYPLLANWVIKLPLLALQLFRSQEAPPDWLPLRAATKLLLTETNLLVAHIARWLSGLNQGNIDLDPLVLVMLWSFIVWVLSFWAAWILRRYQRADFAIMPGIAILAVMLNYQGLDERILLVPLGAGLLLMALNYYSNHLASWHRKKIDYAEDIGSDWILTASLLLIAIMVMAAFIPYFSIQPVVAWARQLVRPASESAAPVAEALGLEPQAVSARSSGAAQSLTVSNSHSLGSRPDLSQDTIFYATVIEPAYSPPPIALYEHPEIPVDLSAPRYYWRVLTYDIYTGDGWLSSSHRQQSFSANQAVFDQIPDNQMIIRQQIKPMVDLDGMLYASGNLISTDQDFRVSWRTTPLRETNSPDKFSLADPFAAAVVTPIADQGYTVTSTLAMVTGEQLRASSTDYPPEIAERYLQLPDELPLRVRELAYQLITDIHNPFDQALAIEHFLRQIPYSIDIPAPPRNRDGVDYFLFSEQKGFCDYYASAMVVLARAAGIPARIVMGYAPGLYDPSQRRYVIVEADAHSWVEIYFSGIGWVEFEPTAAQPEIVHPDQGSQSVGLSDVALPPAEIQPTTSWIDILKRSAFIGGLAILILGAIGAQFFLIAQAVESWWWKRQPAEQAIYKVYDRMRLQGERVLIEVQAGDTPYEFSRRLQSRLESLFKHPFANHRPLALERILTKRLKTASEAIHKVTVTYAQTAYSDRPVTVEASETTFQNWRKLWTLLVWARLLNRRKGD